MARKKFKKKQRENVVTVEPRPPPAHRKGTPPSFHHAKPHRSKQALPTSL
jgi:hypothetical protein